MINKKFSWRERARSFKYAFQGIPVLFRDEHNARIHLVAACLAIALAAFFNIRQWQWCAIIICIGLVFAAEAFNSAIEAIADNVSPEFNPLIKKAKDIAAAAVLFLAAAAITIGLIIFLPYIFHN